MYSNSFKCFQVTCMSFKIDLVVFLVVGIKIGIGNGIGNGTGTGYGLTNICIGIGI